VLTELGKQQGMLGTIFRKAQNRITDPAKLRRLIVNLIDQEKWTTVDADVKGDAYEGLLQKGAEDTKSGAGQYFTPRALIRAIVAVMQPQPGDTIADPACGTGGFLLAAREYIAEHNPVMDPDEKKHLRDEAFHGWEIVDGTARLCAMNMLLHGIGTADGQSPVRVEDALRADPGDRFSMVLANPPFGKKSSVNFVQHIKTMLEINGRAAVVVPDNVLFEGGAGETIRRKLLATCDVHTLLRLPTGIFYAQGVKANVIFFEKKPAQEAAWTRKLWVYDLRTNKHFTLKQNPLTEKDLDEFVEAYKPGALDRRVESERFKSYSYDELVSRDKANLDLIWLKDESLEDAASLPAPQVLLAEITEELEAVLASFAELAAVLPEES
jgi:type I restriction enzyme M protein